MLTANTLRAFIKHLSLWAWLCFPIQTWAQDEQKVILRDTIDNKLDVSDFLINMHGFIPIPSLITEPALGNFGLAIAPIFISPQKHKTNKDRFHFPDITAAFGAYTLNQSWMIGGFRSGSIPSWGLRYTVGAGFGDINMAFYRDLPVVGDHKFEMGIKTRSVSIETSKNIYRNRVFVGVHYNWSQTDFSSDNPVLPADYFNESEMAKTKNGNIGILTDVDFRNSIFTADKGVRWKTMYKLSDNFTGSDFDFDRLESFVNVFVMPTHNWVSGFRVEFQGITDGCPFYSYPYLNMRGIPLMRYQGKQTALFETEQRFDFNLRWSMVAFVGSGRTWADQRTTTNETWHWAGGTGVRYLVSRIFKLRMGIDIAKGPDQYAYYIVFGHSWNR